LDIVGIVAIVVVVYRPPACFASLHEDMKSERSSPVRLALVNSCHMGFRLGRTMVATEKWPDHIDHIIFLHMLTRLNPKVLNTSAISIYFHIVVAMFFLISPSVASGSASAQPFWRGCLRVLASPGCPKFFVHCDLFSFMAIYGYFLAGKAWPRVLILSLIFASLRASRKQPASENER